MPKSPPLAHLVRPIPWIANPNAILVMKRIAVFVRLDDSLSDCNPGRCSDNVRLGRWFRTAWIEKQAVHESVRMIGLCPTVRPLANSIGGVLEVGR